MSGILEDLPAAATDRLRIFVGLLEKWNAAINLVSPPSLAKVWDRHILDSAQLLPLVPPSARTWVDVGSGGGFPGMVVAILMSDRPVSVTLVESDQRKCAFLAVVSRETGVAVTILPQRSEDVPPLEADIVSARALAPLTQLCTHAFRHLARDGTALFLKGRAAQDEIVDARKTWSFDLTCTPSLTDPAASILQLKDLRHV